MLLSTTTIHLQNVHGRGNEQSGADPTKSAVTHILGYACIN